MSTVFFVHIGTFVQRRSCCLLLSTKRIFWIKAWKSYPSGGQVTWDFNLPDCKVVCHGQADRRLFLTLVVSTAVVEGCFDLSTVTTPSKVLIYDNIPLIWFKPNDFFRPVLTQQPLDYGQLLSSLNHELTTSSHHNIQAKRQTQTTSLTHDLLHCK